MIVPPTVGVFDGLCPNPYLMSPTHEPWTDPSDAVSLCSDRLAVVVLYSFKDDYYKILL